MPLTTSGSELPVSIVSRTVYEDAEDGTINGWLAYGDGKVMNVEDASGNHVIMTEGDVTEDPFRLGLEDQSDWDNTNEFTASFAMLMDNDAAIYFRIDSTEGEKYLCYRPGQDTQEPSDTVLYFGLGIEPDGQWHTISRNLATDLSTALPSAKLRSVKDFYVYGSAKLDDIMLINVDKGDRQ